MHRTPLESRIGIVAAAGWIGCAVILGLLTPNVGLADDEFRSHAQATIRVSARVWNLSGGGASDEAVALIEQLNELAKKENFEALDVATSEARAGRYFENGLIRLSLVGSPLDPGTVATKSSSGSVPRTDDDAQPQEQQILIEFVGS